MRSKPRRGGIRSEAISNRNARDKYAITTITPSGFLSPRLMTGYSNVSPSGLLGITNPTD
ncbi:MAG: hypothetical protein JNK14_00580 [Chitinophagaceae bacterium]|nr:hypothetical protein [Chitinophagaceae bacterium]